MIDPEKRIRTAIDGVVALYKETHELTEAQEEEVRGDFLRFYAHAVFLGLKGIRWKFHGCIMCGRTGKLHRILLLYPQIMLQLNRAFGCLACEDHVHLASGYNDEMLDAVLRRLKRDPVK